MATPKLKDKKIIIYKYISTKDPYGFPVDGYMPIHEQTNIWSYFKQLSASLYFASAQTNVKEDCMFQVNWLDYLKAPQTEHLHVFYDGLLYQVTRIDPFEDYKRNINIYATYESNGISGTIIPYDPTKL